MTHSAIEPVLIDRVRCCELELDRHYRDTVLVDDVR